MSTRIYVDFRDPNDGIAFVLEALGFRVQRFVPVRARKQGFALVEERPGFPPLVLDRDSVGRSVDVQRLLFPNDDSIFVGRCDLHEDSVLPLSDRWSCAAGLRQLRRVRSCPCCRDEETGIPAWDCSSLAEGLSELPPGVGAPGGSV